MRNHGATGGDVEESDVTAADGYAFDKRTTLWVFSLFVAMMILDFADRMIMAALLPSIKAEWGISDAQAGLLNSALFIGMIIFSIPVAIAVDRWSRVKSAALMGGFWSFASGAGAFAQNIGQLTISRAGVGSAQAGYTPAAVAWIMAAFPKRRRQLALGTFIAGQPIGMAIGVALGGYIASHYGWRHALGIVAVPGFVVAVLLYRGRDYERPVAVQTDEKKAVSPLSVRDSLAIIFRTPTLRWVYLYSAMQLFQMASVAYFLPSFLHATYDLPVAQASYMTGAVLMTGVVGAPFGGWLIDLWSTRYREAKVAYPLLAIFGATALYAVAFGLPGNALEIQYGCIVMAVLIVTSGTSGPFAVSQELVPMDIRALSTTCNALLSHVLGSAPGPVLTGVVSDHTSLKFALLSIAVCSGIAAVLSLCLAKRHYLDDLDRMGAA